MEAPLPEQTCYVKKSSGSCMDIAKAQDVPIWLYSIKTVYYLFVLTREAFVGGVMER
jgi:hypothetical protein